MATSLGKDPYDGKLFAWDEVKDAEDWDGLVLGNGASINVWSDFQYASLFEQAKTSGLFTSEDEALFEKLGSQNFEDVLHALSESIRVGEAFGERRKTDRARHKSIQKALAKAVQRVHVTGGEIPQETFEAIYDELREYRHVFTTSYDLLLYWAAAKGGPSPFKDFTDFFWVHPRQSFDEETIRIHPRLRWTRLYFLHGALHLVAMSDGTTCKRKASMWSLLDQFGLPFQGDRAARPLVVTEARASDKLRSIDGNDYLAYCWRTLRERECPIVVFGHSLSEQDRHLVDALNEHPKRPLAVSLRDAGKMKNRRAQHRVSAQLDARKIYFFDARTHPLGSDDLRLRETAWRKSVLSSKKKVA